MGRPATDDLEFGSSPALAELEAPALPPLTALVKEWTSEQWRQASIAIFEDHNLSFSLSPADADGLPRAADPDTAVDGSLPRVHRAVIGSVLDLDWVGGLDISFREDGLADVGVATLAVLSWPALKVAHSVSTPVALSAPYIPSFLSFREAEPLAALVNNLRGSGLPFPQVLFVDGNGRLHPCEAGSAVAIGLLTGVPTLGVAKDYHPVASFAKSPDPARETSTHFLSTQKAMRGACRQVLLSRGDWFGLQGSEQSCSIYVGAALLSSPSPSGTNPIFVSPGHHLSLSTTTRLALASCIASRVPEPIRQADAIGRAEARRLWGSKKDGDITGKDVSV